MAWEQTLQDASFRGIPFDIIKTDDTAERSLVEHSYPFVDGSDIEDLGRGARHVSVDAFFYGDDYEVKLNRFLKALDGYDDRFPDPLNHPNAYLVHPVFGDMLVKVARYAIHHEAENVDQASVTVEFVEATPGGLFFDRVLLSQKADAVAQPGAAATAAATEAQGAVVDRVLATNPLAGLDALRQAMTGPLLAAVGKISGVVTSGLDVLAYPRAWGSDIAALVNGILDARDFGAALMADWASIQSNITLFDVFGAQPAAAHAPAQISATAAPTEQQAAAATAATVKVNAAVGIAAAAGLLLAAEAATPTMTPPQIEAIANTARGALEAAMVDVRAVYPLEIARTITEPLRDQALAVQEAARAIIEARPPLIRRTVKAPGNLRLVAHEFYGDHTRALELLRLNNLRLPNFIQAGDVLNAYSN